MQNSQRNRLGLDRERLRRGNVHVDLLAALEQIMRLTFLAVDAHAPAADQMPDRTARKFIHMGGDKPVQPFSLCFGRDGQIDLFHDFSHHELADALSQSRAIASSGLWPR